MYRADDFRAGRILFYFQPQPAYVHRHRIFVHKSALAVPQLRQDLLLTQHLPFIFHEIKQQPVFLIAEGKLFLSSPYSACGFIQCDTVGIQLLRLRAAAQKAVDSRFQHRKGKGLGQVVVRSQIQGLHLVQLGIPGGEHQHRRLCQAADPFAELKAAPVRQVTVQKNEITGVFSKLLFPLFHGRSRNDRIAFRFQGVGQPLLQIHIILYYKYCTHFCSLHNSSCLRNFTMPAYTA